VDIHCANHEASLGIPSQLQEYILSPLDQKILSNSLIFHQLETPHRQWQTHRPTIEIVSVKILDVF